MPTDEMTQQHVAALNTKLSGSCALVGASPLLKGNGHGLLIDSNDVVIRVNRVPTEPYYWDFGKRTDILYSNAVDMYEGMVTLMGDGDDAVRVDCVPPRCLDYLGMFFRGDYGCDFDRLRATWGNETGFILGCTTRNLTKIAYSFKLLQNVEPTSGFMAFLTFAPVCRKITLYGFGGDGSVDGHTEWEGHSLYYEHFLLRLIEQRQWDLIEFAEAAEWLEQHLPAGNGGVEVSVFQH